MKAITVLVPLAVLCAGAVTADIRLGRIPNVFNASCFACGLCMSIARAGPVGLASSLQGAALGLAILALPFALRMVGAGDVKFLAAAGAITGCGTLWSGFLLGAAVGGALALLALARRARSIKSLHGRLLLLERTGWRLSNALGPGEQIAIPYAVPLSVGLLLAAGLQTLL